MQTLSTRPAKEKKQEVLQQLHDGIKKLLESGDWSKFLKTQAKFHSYSANNCFLILASCPEATKVNGYKAWQKLNRQVRKGEKAIKILAPMRKKVETDDDEESKYIIRGFRTASVFDISQTEGEDLPVVDNQENRDARALLESLMELAQAKNIAVAFKLCRGRGFCQYDGGKPFLININPELSPLYRAKTMSHELAHAILHGTDDYQEHRGDKELEAESTAFVVMSHFGFDTSDYSFGYVAHWQRAMDKDVDGTLAQLTNSASAIHTASQEIIDFLEQ